MKKLYFTLIVLIFFFNPLLGQDTPRKVSLQLSWLHQFQFAGYYMAKEKGYYKDLGLDVSFKEMTNEVNPSKDVLNGTSTYSVGRSSIILNKLQGDDIVALFAIFQNSPLILLSLKESNFKSLADLKNKKIMLTQDAIGTVAIHAMLMSNGLKLEELNFQNHSYDIKDLIDKKTDAYGAYISNEPYALDGKGIAYTIFNPRDYGFNFYDGILFTSKQELDMHPQDVYNFYKASLKGWQYAFNNISETVQIIYNKYNTQNKTLDALLYEAYALKELAFNSGNPLGLLEQDKVEEIAKIYSLLGFTKNLKLDLTNFIYNNKMPVFSKKEKEFLLNKKIVYLNETYEPLYLYDNPTHQGIATDIWNILCQNTNINSEYKTIFNSAEAIENLNLNQHTIKIELPNESTNKLNVIYSKTIKSYPYAIATRNNEDFIAAMTKLNNKTVFVIKNSQILKNLKNKYPNVNFIEVKNTQIALEMLSLGRGFALIDILPSLTHAIKENSFSNIKISGTTPYSYNLRYMANEKEKELMAVINKAIETVDSKTLEKIEEEYFKLQYTSYIDYDLLYKVGIPLSIFLLIFFLYNIKLKHEIEKRKETEEKLYKAATTDTLTNINNRSQIDNIFQNELTQAKRYNTPLSIIFFDIDNFKRINDNFGHALADTVLIDLATISKKHIRAADQIGRWGGEEFLIVLSQTNLEQATKVANNLKEQIEQYAFKINQKVTCSFGVTEVLNEDTQNSALTRVDKLMYYIKEHGKNGVKAG